MRSRASEPSTLDGGRYAELELDAPAVMESIDLVQDLVAEIVAGTTDDLDFTDRMRFETALVEIVGNVIEHGVRVAGRPLTMHITVQRRGQELTAFVVDDGVEATIDIDGAEMSGDDEEDGRGLAMARALASELRYERDGLRNRWTVRCACAG